MPHGRTALVTDGSGEIGYRVCRELAERGTSVIVHDVTEARARAVADRLVDDGADPELVHAAAADFRRLDEVCALAQRLRCLHPRIDLLINNAGALEPDGDHTFQVNYLAPYALTRLLIPALSATAGRVVSLISPSHRAADLDPDRPGAAVHRPADAYAQAHLALVLFRRALARISDRQVTAVAVHPGIIDSGSFAPVHGRGGLPAADGATHVLRTAESG